MDRLIRMRRYNSKSLSGKFDTLFPQTITENILRSEDGGVLEANLLQYDRHLTNETMHMNRALSEGTARALSVHLIDAVLVDDFPLLLTLHTDLECEPTLSFNDGAAYPIVASNGDGIPGGQTRGSAIFLVWKESLSKWVLMSASNFSDVTKIVLPVESEYVYTALSDGEELVTIPGFNKRADRLSINYGQTILRYGIDYEYDEERSDTVHLGFGLQAGDLLYCTITTFITSAKRGHYRYDLKASDHDVEARKNGTKTFKLPAAAASAHSVVVNYNQTILRNNLDYTFNEAKDEITLKDFSLKKGEKLVFTITQFVEAPGEVVPNNFGATGNYRYSLNVVHTGYKATEDNITVITVPGFNSERDDITVIRNNKMYIFDVDYTIDEIGNVVLLKDILNTDDEIFFTILQGAMMDVPNFNVIRASGQDDNHILLDMSYSILCNFYTLMVQLKYDLKPNSTVKCIDGPAEQLLDCYGNPITGGYKKGSYLWMVYSESIKGWFVLNPPDNTEATTVTKTSGTGQFSGFHLIDETLRTDDKQYIETAIEHRLGKKPSIVNVVPCEPPNLSESGDMTRIGDIWVTSDDRFIYVGNTGNATSKFSWTAEL